MLKDFIRSEFKSLYRMQSSKVKGIFDGLDLKLGCDPEFFLYDKQKQRIVPANGLVPGCKEKPYVVQGGNVQLDGTVLEIGTDPASSGEEFLANIESVINWVRGHLGDRYEIRCGAVAKYYKWESRNIPQGALRIGCSTQYKITSTGSSYVLRETSPSSDTTNVEKVPIGGHLHFGFCSGEDITNPLHLRDCSALAFNFERLFGLDQRILDWYNNSPGIRKVKVFPNAQRPVRVKDYGFEYRSPSSYWMFSREIIECMYDLYKTAVLLSVQDVAHSSAIRDRVARRIRSTELLPDAFSHQSCKTYQKTLSVLN